MILPLSLGAVHLILLFLLKIVDNSAALRTEDCYIMESDYKNVSTSGKQHMHK